MSHRAVQWFYILKVAFGSKMYGPFGYGTTRPSNLNTLDLEESIIEIHWRLARVTLENTPSGDVIERYGRPHILLPRPAVLCIKGYRLNSEPKNFEELAQALADAKGKFLMSLNDHPAVRRIFGGFKIQLVLLRYSCMRKITSRGATRGR